MSQTISTSKSYSRFKSLSLLALSLTAFPAYAGNSSSNLREKIKGNLNDAGSLSFKKSSNSSKKLAKTFQPKEMVPIARLPNDMRSNILSYLNVPSQYSCVNRDFHKLSKKIIARETSFKAKRYIPVQTQLESYLLPSGIGNLTDLDLDDCDVTDQELQWITERFPKIKSLKISGSRVTAIGLRSLPKLNDLTLLHWMRGDADNAAVRQLSTLTKLTSLRLGSTNFTELHHLWKLTSLTSLALEWSYARIPSSEYRHLASLKNLASLTLRSIKINDETLAYLSALTSLTSLNLSNNSAVNNDQLHHFTGLTNLAHLNLSETDISDEGLPQLLALPKLTTLITEDTAVTPEGKVQIQNQLKSQMESQ